MSGSQNPPYETNPFTSTERSDIRKFMGYGAAGLSSYIANYRFFQTDGLLEARMTNMSDSECVQIRAYLATCNALESSLAGIGSGATDTLTASAAASYVHNANEISDRQRLLNIFCLKLCGIFRLPPGPGLQTGNSFAIEI